MGRSKIKLDVIEVESLLDNYVKEYGITSKLAYKDVHQYFNGLIEKGEFEYSGEKLNISYWRIPERQGREIIDNYNEKKFNIQSANIDFIQALEALKDINGDNMYREKIIKELIKRYLNIQSKQKLLEDKVSMLEDKLEKENKRNFHLENILFAFSQTNSKNRTKHLLQMQNEFISNLEDNLIDDFNYNINKVTKPNDEIVSIFDDFEN